MFEKGVCDPSRQNDQLSSATCFTSFCWCKFLNGCYHALDQPKTRICLSWLEPWNVSSQMQTIKIPSYIRSQYLKRETCSWRQLRWLTFVFTYFCLFELVMFKTLDLITTHQVDENKYNKQSEMCMKCNPYTPTVVQRVLLDLCVTAYYSD